MLKNYLTIALRILWREKVYGLINIAGLSIGVACFVIIVLYLNNEFSYDKHHKNLDQIYRISEEQYRNGTFYELSANIGPLIGPYLKRDYPEVLEYVRFSGPIRSFFGYEDQLIYETDVQYADNSVFDVFTHQIISGDKETALISPLSIAVSESFAQRHFGEVDSIGEVISTDTTDYTVTLVFADLPQTSHRTYDALISIDTFLESFEPSLTANTSHTYLMMVEGYDPKFFQDTWLEFEERYMEGLRGRGYTGDQLFLEPLSDIYLYSGVTSGVVKSANIFSLYAFATIGIFILLVACINYMNLATARSLKRVKEVSVRKVLGAGKIQLIVQLLGESLLLSLLSVLFGLGIVEFVLSIDSINVFIGQNLSLSMLTMPSLLLGVISLVLLLGLLAGSYPAYYVSTNLPSQSTHAVKKADTKFSLQNVLIALQFTISIAVVATTILMFSQIQYVQNRSLGFDMDNKILVSLWGADAIERGVLFFDELENSGQIQGASYVPKGMQPGIFLGGEWPVGVPGTPFEEWREFNRIYVDEKFLELMNIDVTQGRNFNAANSTDQNEAVLVNEAALQQMGWNDPIGKSIGIAFNPATIVGVIGDFQVRGLHQQLRPTVVSYINMDFRDLPTNERSSQSRTAIVSLSEGAIGDFLATINDEWQTIDPLHSLEFQILEEQLNQQYFSEQQQLQLFGIFSALCIFISSLGLLGLASFSTELRTKEIGIRRVLGATVPNIILMLFKTTAYLLIGAALVASIASFWASSQWLERFYYQVEINPFVFILATGFTMIIAFITVSTQAYRTAITNPVEALRYE